MSKTPIMDEMRRRAASQGTVPSHSSRTISDKKITVQLNSSGDAEYYRNRRIESLRSFEQTHGTLAAMYVCEFNSHKYRGRIGDKDDQSLEQEMVKIRWYDRAAKHYFDKYNSERRINGIDVNGVVRHKWDD